MADETHRIVNEKAPKLYFIAGEQSGDLHGSNLLISLLSLRPKLTTRGVGGDKLRAAGMEVSIHIRETDFMGFWVVLKNIFIILQLFKRVKADIEDFQPDAVILIDYPGFNLRMARYLKEKGIPVIYYISPQVWAWKKNRVYKIRDYVDNMLVILPFEKEFFKSFGVDVTFVGHPLLDEVSTYFQHKKDDPEIKILKKNRPLITLLPGSRKQEIQKMLPIMLKMQARFPDHSFAIAGAAIQPLALYTGLCQGYNIPVIFNKTYDLLTESEVALVTSGTATLETALLNVPQVVCYSAFPGSYFLARLIVKIKFISLVNLILGREAVKELIQYDFNVQNLEEELNKLLDPVKRESVTNDYTELQKKLGGPGASTRAAEHIVNEFFTEPDPNAL